MSPFGKKAQKPGSAQPPFPPVGVAKAPVGGRKRITQRLVLSGKGVETGEINVGSGLKIPGAPDPVLSQAIPSASNQGTVDVPFSSLLGFIPAEFVISDHETLYNSPQAQEMVSLPLSVVLPMLPSGKIEFLAQDLVEYLPEGTMKSAEELGDYAFSPVALPLPEIISRIPEDAMYLRSDQKPIDDSVAQMDAPFSAEMLAAAQEAAASQAGEQGFDVNAVEEVSDLPNEMENDGSQPDPENPLSEEDEQQVDFSTGFGAEEETVVPPQPPDFSERERAEPEEEFMPPPPANQQDDGLDFSFTQSEEYKKFLAEAEASAEDKGAPGAENSVMDESAQEGTEAPESELQVPDSDDAAPTVEIPHMLEESGDTTDSTDAEMTAPIPRPVQESYEKMSALDSKSEEGADLSGESEESQNPLFAPTRVVPKKSPENVAPPKKAPPQPVASSAPESATPKTSAFSFSKPPVPPSKSVAKPAGFKLPPPPVSKPVPDVKPPAPPKPAIPKPPVPEHDTESASDVADPTEDFVVSSQLANMLGIRDHEPSLKDIVRQINCWPGMKGCIIGGKDGLRISSDVDDDSFANSISAFAPKLISRISELFDDLGFSEVQELHTPVQDSSVYIFRKDNLYLIVLFEDASFPESYRNLMKRVLEELNYSKES